MIGAAQSWGDRMSTRQQSWDRLSAAAWLGEPGITRMISGAGATPQPLSGGFGSILYDEYAIKLQRLPATLSPEQLIFEFAENPNRAVNFGTFNTINIFTRRTPGTPPQVGDIFDINLVGPDNGCVMIVEMSPGFGNQTDPSGAYFDVQAIETPEYGTLPEYGAREFGFEYAGSGAVFYTRGASRARDIAAAVVGKGPQQIGWVAAMTGIRNRVRSAGGSADEDVQRAHKAVQPS